MIALRIHFVNDDFYGLSEGYAVVRASALYV